MKKFNLSELKKLGNIGNVENVGICYPGFLLPSFRCWVLGQNQKVGREKAGKKFPRFPTFPRFLSFRPGVPSVQNDVQKIVPVLRSVRGTYWDITFDIYENYKPSKESTILNHLLNYNKIPSFEEFTILTRGIINLFWKSKKPY